MLPTPKSSLGVCWGSIWCHQTMHNSCLLTTTIINNNWVCHITIVTNICHHPPLLLSPPTTIHNRHSGHQPWWKRHHHQQLSKQWSMQVTTQQHAILFRQWWCMPSSLSAVCSSVITFRSPSFVHTKCGGHIAHGNMATIPPACNYGDNDNQHKTITTTRITKTTSMTTNCPHMKTTAHEWKQLPRWPSTYEDDTHIWKQLPTYEAYHPHKKMTAHVQRWSPTNKSEGTICEYHSPFTPHPPPSLHHSTPPPSIPPSLSPLYP